jgi:hypothetical protein
MENKERRIKMARNKAEDDKAYECAKELLELLPPNNIEESTGTEEELIKVLISYLDWVEEGRKEN